MRSRTSPNIALFVEWCLGAHLRIKMKTILALILLVTSLSAFAVDRNLTVEKRYIWTIKDTPCVNIKNPDKLDLKEAAIKDLMTGETATGCAFDDGKNIEFQIYLEKNRAIQLTFPTRVFKPAETI